MGDDSWFVRLTPFQRQETKRQTEHKRCNWPSLGDGTWGKNRNHSYPHILPAGYIEYGFAPGVFPRLAAYLGSHDIQLHTEILNLRSSQACCWNFFFPLREDLPMAADALRFLLIGVKEVLSIELEYTGEEGATIWLGEPPGGKRGQNRTSVDTAVRWIDDRGQQRITFVEWKYTEAKFGTCGGYKSDGNDDKNACRTLRVELVRPKRDCYLSKGTTVRNDRHYWERLRDAGINLELFDGRAGCPFMGPFYQLMRLHLLAAHTKSHLKCIDRVEVAVVCFRGNTDLLKIPDNLACLGPSIPEAWCKLLGGEMSFHTAFIEDIVRDACKKARIERSAWMRHFQGRYGLEVK